MNANLVSLPQRREDVMVVLVVVELPICPSLLGGEGLLSISDVLPLYQRTHKKSVAHSSVRRDDMLSAGKRISQALVANHNLNIRRPISIVHLNNWRRYTVTGIVRGI